MPLSRIHTRAVHGLDAVPVTVEVQLTGGEFRTSIVGLTETAVKEASFRVRAALRHSGFELPTGHVIVHLAPADLKKGGGRFDLPIALGILAASGQIAGGPLGTAEFIGELGLDGELRAVTGALPTAAATRACGRELFVPAVNAPEGALVDGLTVRGARSLLDVCAHLAGTAELPPSSRPQRPVARYTDDLADLRGQPRARRALEIAAAGGHNLLMFGPPGTGKSMLATRLPGIMPPLDDTEALEVAAIASLVEPGTGVASSWGRRPFRRPHHSASHVALVGGGAGPQPGEITRAHRGVLFLDELPEFPRRSLEALREPLETGRIVVSRAARQVEYPARFQLVAAMNPCPCGYLGDTTGRCNCTADQVERYRTRISGPLLDRIDLHVEVARVPLRYLRNVRRGESSASVRARVVSARARQFARQGCSNAELDGPGAERHAHLDDAGGRILGEAIDRLGLSARAYHRVLKVARTIADLAGADGAGESEIAEATGYRSLDRKPSG